MEKPEQATAVIRVQRNVLFAAEARFLLWICERLPRWVTPDKLTALGLASALGICVAYALSSVEPLLLWAAAAGYIVHWFGDSLDGSLARHRKIERPNYGYFVDHSADALATLLIMTGMGLSPYIQLETALLAAAAYLLISVHSFLVTNVTRVFRLSHLGFGPTELRLVLIGLTVLMFLLGPQWGQVGGLSGFDIIVGGGALTCISVFIVQTLRIARELRRDELLGEPIEEVESQAAHAPPGEGGD